MKNSEWTKFMNGKRAERAADIAEGKPINHIRVDGRLEPYTIAGFTTDEVIKMRNDHFGFTIDPEQDDEDLIS
jgi:hypothetical protein